MLSKNLARLKTIVLRLICRICVKIHNKITATVGTMMAFQLTFLAKLLKMKYVYPEPHKNIKLMIEVSKKEAVMLLFTITRISSNLLMCCTRLVYFNLDYCQFYYECIIVKLLLRCPRTRPRGLAAYRSSSAKPAPPSTTLIAKICGSLAKAPSHEKHFASLDVRGLWHTRPQPTTSALDKSRPAAAQKKFLRLTSHFFIFRYFYCI